MKDNYEVDTVCAYSNSADIQFLGKCITAQEGLAVIQLSGYVEGEIDEKIPLGYRHLSVDGNNHIQIDKSCETRLVVYSDDHKVGFIL
jgi:hypothetical protein